MNVSSHIRSAYKNVGTQLKFLSAGTEDTSYYSLLLPWFFLIFGLTLTYSLQKSLRISDDQLYHESLDYQANKITESINERLKDYEQVLTGGAGLFAVTGALSGNELTEYARALKLKEKLPEIQGIRFAQLVRIDEKTQHISDVAGGNNRANYNMHHEGQRDIYSSTLYLGPPNSRNQRAIDYDMYSGPVRRIAMEFTLNEEKVSTSREVRLVQETAQNAQSSFLMYLPIYSAPSNNKKNSQYGESLIGWIYAPFRICDFMEGVLGVNPDKISAELNIKVYDGNSTTEDILIFNSKRHGDLSSSEFHVIKHIPIYGHQWTLVISSLTPFKVGSQQNSPTIVTLTGIIASVLAAFIVWLLVVSRKRAITIANGIRWDFLESRQQLVEAQRISGLGVWTWDSKLQTIRGTEKFSDILGLKPGEAFADLFQLVIPEDRLLLQTAFSESLHGKRHDIELCIKRLSDGALRHVHITGELSNRTTTNDKKLIGIIRDITERKEIDQRVIDSERQFRELVELLPEGLLIHHKWRVIFANPAAARLLGASSPIQLLGQDYFQLIDPSSQDAVKDQTENIINNPDFESIFLPRRMRRLDGGRVEVEAAAQNFILNGKKCIQVVIRDVMEHRRLQIELENANLRSQRVSSELIHIQESERRHLARELHDDVGQLLTFIKISASSLRSKLKGEQQQSLATLTDIAAEALSKVRNLSRTLRPVQLDALGLQAAIGWQLETYLNTAELSWSLTGETLEPRPTSTIEIALFRIFQEALSNVLKHAEANHVKVKLGRESDWVYLSVRDNGRGLNQEEAMLESQGIGLLSMTERAKLLGGKLLVISSPNQGTEIKALLPEERSQHE